MIRRAYLDQQGDLEKEILSLIFEEQRSDSLNANLSRATRAAAQVRDRLSTDLLRIVSQMGSIARASGPRGLGLCIAGGRPGRAEQLYPDPRRPARH